MANKIYSLVFTTGNPQDTFVLSPTLVRFFRQDTGGALTAPGITQAGVSSGIFQFEYLPTLPIAFIADGGASAPIRYIPGNLDPIQWIDQVAVTLTAIGTTNLGFGSTGNALGTTSVAIGTTLLGYGTSIYAGTQTLLASGTSGTTAVAIGTSILAILGTTASSIGSTSTDPSDLFGMLKRTQEFLEGNAQFTKTSGLWEIKTRGSTLFATKTLANAVSTVTKT